MDNQSSPKGRELIAKVLSIPPQAPHPGLLLLLLVLVAYVNSFPGAFIYDDVGIVRDNPLVINPELKRIFQSDYWGEGYATGAYRPLMILSLALNRMLLGPAAWGYHLVNVILHAGVSLLIWRVLLCYKFPPPAAWLAAALFAVHPIHTEVVNEIVGRSELQAALFLLGGLLAATSRHRFWTVLAPFCFLLAMLSKEHAITILVILPLLDAFVAGSCRIWWQRRHLYTAIAFISLCWIVWRNWQLSGGLPLEIDPVYVAPAYLPTAVRVLTALKLQGLYLGKLLWPVGLQGIYSGPGFPEVVTSLWSVSGASIVICTLVFTSLCLLGWRRRDPLALCALVYGTAILPTSNIVFPIGLTFSERLAYFPSIWFCAGLALLVTRLALPPGRFLFAGGLALSLVAGFASLCLARNHAFVSEADLWQADIRRNPTNVLAWVNLATLAESQGQVEQAERSYSLMLQALPPDYPGGWHCYALFLLRQGRTKEGLSAALMAEERWRADNDPRGDFDRMLVAYALLELGEFAEALSWLERGARIVGNPDWEWELRGKALVGLQRDFEAVAAFARIGTFIPGTDVAEQYGLSLLRCGRVDEAKRMLELAIQLRESAVVWNALGTVHARAARWSDAIQAFERASTLSPKNNYYAENLRRAQRMEAAAPKPAADVNTAEKSGLR